MKPTVSPREPQRLGDDGTKRGDPRLAPTLPSDPQITIRPLRRAGDGGDPTRVDGTLVSPAPPRAPDPTPDPPRRRELPQLSVDLDATVSNGRSNPPSSPDRGPDLEVRGLLGEGGMGRVLLARQHSLDREVAVKTVRSGAGDHERESLLAEGAIVGFLEHPSIVPVHALGLDPVGRPVLVMKRIDGVEWSDLLDDPGHAAWPASMSNVDERLVDHVEILMQVCNALHFAHERGVLHRDVKPQNVLIGQYGDVYLADWGIAHRTKSPLPPGMAGTPAFMAPEMVTNDAIDARTDVYLLGATLHRVLTGSPRHPGKSVHETLENAARSAPFDYGEDVPADLAALANEATAREPEQRPSTALAFRARLASHLRHRSSVAIARSASERLAKLEELVATERADDPERGADIDVLAAETRFGLREALAQWAENTRAKEDLARVDAITAARRARAAEHARKAQDLDPALSGRQRNIALVLIAIIGVGMSVARISKGVRYVPDDTELIVTGALPFVAIVLALILFRRHLLASVVNRVSSVLLPTVVALVLVSRILAVRAGTPAATIAVTDSMIMASGLFVSAAMTFRWVVVPGAMMLGSGVASGLAPDFAAFWFALATGLAFVFSVTMVALRVGYRAPTPRGR